MARGRIKGRECTDEQKQREYISKEEPSSPTISTDFLMTTLVIDTHEGRDVITYDIVGTYLNADMDEFTTMKLEGEMVDMMVRVDSAKYSRYVRYKHHTKVLYHRVMKTIYGCVKSGLLSWYNLFTGSLEEEGFILSLYDPCVANKTIDDKQCTMT